QANLSAVSYKSQIRLGREFKLTLESLTLQWRRQHDLGWRKCCNSTTSPRLQVMSESRSKQPFEWLIIYVSCDSQAEHSDRRYTHSCGGIQRCERPPMAGPQHISDGLP